MHTRPYETVLALFASVKLNVKYFNLYKIFPQCEKRLAHTSEILHFSTTVREEFVSKISKFSIKQN